MSAFNSGDVCGSYEMVNGVEQFTNKKAVKSEVRVPNLPPLEVPGVNGDFVDCIVAFPLSWLLNTQSFANASVPIFV